MTTITEHFIPGPHGDIRIRIYQPDVRSGIGIVWIHGGAFFLNDIDVPEVHWVAQQLAAAGVAVVTPDYQLANTEAGVHFPVLSDECLTTWQWASATTSHTNADVREWHIGGGSAGGNLAAAVSMQLRDEHAPIRPLSNVLVYPALHSTFPEPSAELASKLATLPDGEMYTDEQSCQINLNYVGDPALLEHPYAFPGHGHLDGLPPTLLINAEYDGIRASGERYGLQLVQAGVDTTIIREPDAHHGHLNYPDQPAAHRTVARMIAWLTVPALRGATHPGPRTVAPSITTTVVGT